MENSYSQYLINAKPDILHFHPNSSPQEQFNQQWEALKKEIDPLVRKVFEEGLNAGRENLNYSSKGQGEKKVSDPLLNPRGKNLKENPDYLTQIIFEKGWHAARIENSNSLPQEQFNQQWKALKKEIDPLVKIVFEGAAITSQKFRTMGKILTLVSFNPRWSSESALTGTFRFSKRE